MLAYVLSTLGRLDQAETEACGAAAEAAEEDLAAQVLWRSALAQALTQRGSSDARQTAEQSLALSAGVEFPFLRVTALESAAEVEQATGGTAAATRLLDEARSIMESKGNVVEVARLAARTKTVT